MSIADAGVRGTMHGALALRLPQDAFVGDRTRGVPDLSTLGGTVLHYAARHAKAVADRDLQARAEACWGLVARGAESHAWCLDALGRGGEAGEDAVGVLAWTRIPALLAKQLRARMRTLPKDVARDLGALMMVHRATKDVDWTGVPLAGNGEPFTHILRFIEAPFARFVEEHAAWRERLGARGVDSAHPGDLRALLPLLEPATMNGTKVLILETRPPSPWTAILAQGSDLGWVDHFADRLQTRSVKTSYAPHVVRDGQVRRYGAVSLSICDGRRGDLAPLHMVRVIMASHQESGWDWQLSGEPQPFEELDAYAARTIRARLDLPRLNRYCHALGIRRDEEEFYGPRAILHHVDTSKWARPPPTGIPSAEWRRAHGDERGDGH